MKTKPNPNPDASTKPTRNPNMKTKTNPNPNPNPAKRKTNPDASTKPTRNPNMKTVANPAKRKTNPDAMASSKTIRLASYDGFIFKVEELVALESLTIKKMIEDGCGNKVIPLPNVKGKILLMIIEYCRERAYTDKGDSMAEVKLYSFDTGFIFVDNSTLWEISRAPSIWTSKALSNSPWTHFPTCGLARPQMRSVRRST